jgi:hypothetical protein
MPTQFDIMVDAFTRMAHAERKQVMQLFHRIDDAECIIRARGGVYKQAELYRRGERIFVKAAGGFVRITAKFGESWGTSNPGINVIDMPARVTGLSTAGTQEPRWTGGQGA